MSALHMRMPHPTITRSTCAEIHRYGFPTESLQSEDKSQSRSIYPLAASTRQPTHLCSTTWTSVWAWVRSQCLPALGDSLCLSRDVLLPLVGGTLVAIGPSSARMSFGYVENIARAHLVAAVKLAEDPGTSRFRFFIDNCALCDC